MAFGSSFSEEFKFKNFRYEHHDQTTFYRCQWGWPRPVYITIRVLMAVQVLYGYVIEVVHYYRVARNPDADGTITTPVDNYDYTRSHLGYFSPSSEKQALIESTSTPDPQFNQWDTRRPWFVYFTMWTYTLLLLHQCMCAWLAIAFYGTKDDDTHFNSNQDIENPETDCNGIENPTYDWHGNIITPSLHGSNNTVSNGVKVKGEGQIQNVPDLRLRAGVGDGSTASLPMSPSSTSERGKVPWSFKFSWLLSDIVTPWSPLVTLIFFLALYTGGPLDIYNTNVHVLNTVHVFLDQLICARPSRLLHGLAPTIYGLIYVVFSAIFWSTDHVNHVMYPGVIDWNDPERTMVSVALLALVIMPVTLTLWFLLFRFRLWVHYKIYGS